MQNVACSLKHNKNVDRYFLFYRQEPLSILNDDILNDVLEN